MDNYLTVKSPGIDELIIKKSRFIAQARPVATDADAVSWIKQARAAHPEAGHTCYAYVIGKNEGILRYSDDGEPGGTAGTPILSVIRARKVVDCCVTVTRYFGGVLLGAPGLIRAYAKAASMALDAARVVRMERSVRFWVGMEYAMWERAGHYLGGAPVLNEGAEFCATVTATLVARERDFAAACEGLARVTDGRTEVMELERVWLGWEE